MYIYLLFTDTGTTLNKIIKKTTNAPYNHVSFSLDESLENVYSFGRKIPWNPLVAGFVKEDFHNGTFSYFPNTRCCVMKIPVGFITYDSIVRKLDHFKQNEDNLKYNMRGLFLYHFKLNKKRKNHYFCSEFVTEILGDMVSCPSNRVSPECLRIMFEEYIVYEGALYDYPCIAELNVCFNRYRYHIPLYKRIASKLV